MKIQLSDFSYVKRPNKKNGLALRFTLSISVPLVDGQFWEEAMDGCIAFYDHYKVVRWSPPISRWGPTVTKQLHWYNPTAREKVIETLLGHPKSKEMLDNLRTPTMRLLEMQREERQIQYSGQDLPKLLEGDIEQDEQL